ncbi:hypothetical protein [Enterococcus faecium]|uniref:hypothetical protein n=1 Tax=Enterococcus faecium TaxID=1352 RepID=UPI001FCB318A|nr:hypothetical protein [Enterococcus faecium]
MANENQLSEIQSKIEGRGAEKRTTINQLEKLNRISNRRLSVDDKVHPLKLSWSIDRRFCCKVLNKE